MYKDHALLYKRLEQWQILGSVCGSRTNSTWISRDGHTSKLEKPTCRILYKLSHIHTMEHYAAMKKKE
jgi:hypothetical protein